MDIFVVFLALGLSVVLYALALLLSVLNNID